jgi:hypothetical protein
MNSEYLTEEEINELRKLGIYFNPFKKKDKAKVIKRKTKKSVKYKEDENEA